MACDALETIVKSCDNNSGGIYGIWINQQENISSIVPATPPVSGWEISSIVLEVGAPNFTTF